MYYSVLLPLPGAQLSVQKSQNYSMFDSNLGYSANGRIHIEDTDDARLVNKGSLVIGTCPNFFDFLLSTGKETSICYTLRRFFVGTPVTTKRGLITVFGQEGRKKYERLR